jgi:solute carrier family 25 oxoglutarate transporter 11
MERTVLPDWTKFAIGAVGGATGWLPVHPMDVVKVRAQINTGIAVSPVSVFAGIAKQEGVFGLYAGMSAAMTRQFTYGTMRLGLYDVFRERVVGPGETPNVFQKLACGLSAGGIAAASCCPVEVALVRMQADGAKPAAQQRGYRHVFDAWVRVVGEEGLSALWTGVGPTVVRGMVVSMTQLATYDQAKEVVTWMGIPSGVFQHFSASLISGLIYCWASLPLDVCKSRMQNMRPDSNGVMPYRGVTHALTVIPRKEGIMALWKGFLPYYARGGGHTIFMFLCLEQYRKLFKKIYGISE